MLRAQKQHISIPEFPYKKLPRRPMLHFAALGTNLGTVALPVLLAQVTYTNGEINTTQLILSLIAYLVGAFFSMKIFEKLGVENAWFAWIPILNAYITFVAGDEENPVLWTILALIPCINIVAIVKLIIAWVKICKKLEKSPWLILLWLVPLIGFAIFGYLLAFS